MKTRQASKVSRLDRVDFRDTSVAFKHLSNSELRRAYFLFKILSYPTLTRWAPAFASLSLKFKLPVRSLIKATMFGQFCGGEDIKECSSTIQELGKAGIGTILDFATEACTSESDFEAVKKEVKYTIQLAQENLDVPFAVFKPTALGRLSLLAKHDSKESLTESELREFELIRSRFKEICRFAFEHGVRVLVDAEDSWIQNSVDGLVEEMMKLYNQEEPIVFNTIQLYRRDRLQYLKQSAQQATAGGYKLGVKLVRGAYLEKEEQRAKELRYENPIQPSKEETDRDYNLALEFCLDYEHQIALVAGTHNEFSTGFLMKLMKDRSISPSDRRIYFAQLLGMSDHLSYNLAKSGYNVCKYVPYGRLEELLPYLARRAEENSSIKGQSSRELVMISQELKRRKASR